jgi:hypothetical protein
MIYIMALSTSDCIPLSGRMINELESIWEEAVMAYLRYNPDICLEGLRKTTKNHSG